ncbi:integrase core domain-containing protein [Mycolicibacterium litorale]|uniref:Integrase core domain-containing protein n=1 Tax=Candidatus Mycolicibacterium alkanivorans TaxID=2954114 RepID=A0ABS9YQ44_9MYCO|nr:integrase core domain-containing protein [Candidatus Mycolicibacterium alkanivorans]
MPKPAAQRHSAATTPCNSSRIHISPAHRHANQQRRSPASPPNSFTFAPPSKPSPKSSNATKNKSARSPNHHTDDEPSHPAAAIHRPRLAGQCFDNAAAEAFFASLEWEVLSRNRFRDTIHAQAVVIDWCYTFYNHQRRHSAADGLSPVNYEIRESKTKPEAA